MGAYPCITGGWRIEGEEQGGGISWGGREGGSWKILEHIKALTPSTAEKLVYLGGGGNVHSREGGGKVREKGQVMGSWGLKDWVRA